MRRQRSKRWPSLASSVVQATLSGHSTLGLVAAALVYVVCLTGVPSVFAKELMRWEAPAAAHVTHASTDTMTRALLSTWEMAKAAGDVELVMVFAPEPGLPQLRGRAFGDGEERIWFFDGEGANPVPLHTPATAFVTELHENFHASAWGGALVGFSGIVLAALVISGLFSHPRILRDAFKLRRGGSWRLQEADVHNRLGVWAAPFHLVIALTGAFLGLATILGAAAALILFSGDFDKAASILSGDDPAIRQGASSMSDVSALARTVEAIDANTDVGFILVSRSGQAGQQVFIDVVSRRDLAGGQTYIVDQTGAARAANGYLNGSFAQQLRGAMVPLHYGDFGGLAVKAIYALLGVGLCVVISTGVSIWIARKRERGSPAPGWARLWTALAWGQVLALSLAAAAAFLGQDPMPYWIGLGLAALATGAVRLSLRAFARIWRAVAGAGLGLVAFFAFAREGLPPESFSLLVNAVLLACGGGLAVSALTGAAAPPPEPGALDLHSHRP